MRPVYHYTKGVHWPSIQESGELRLTSVGLAPGEPPSLWCTTDPVFVGCMGAAVASSRRGARDWFVQHAGGAFRVQIDPAVPSQPWRDFAACMPSRTRPSLQKVAKRCGDSVRDWHVYTEPVPRESWAQVERFDPASDAWVPA